MNINTNFKYILLAVLFSFTSFGFGQELTGNILLGQTLSIESKTLNETREIFIYTPEGYQQSTESYPVIYILDGESKFFLSSAIINFLAGDQSIPKFIIVGIPNVNRNKDFTPNVGTNVQNSGGADKFINFLDDELMTYVNSTYRTQDYNILFGHSLTGMFAIYTLFANPNLFDSYIAASPFIMFDDDYVIGIAEEALANKSFQSKQLFISIGDEPNYFASLDKLSEILNAKQSGLNWSIEKYPKENHNTIPLRTIADGLQFVFSDWRLTPAITAIGIDAILVHYKNKETKYGFTSQIPEATLNRVGYELLQAEKVNKAIEVFEYNVNLYPNSANVYDSLGEAYETAGNKDKARKNYEKALNIAEVTNDPNLGIFKINYERVK